VGATALNYANLYRFGLGQSQTRGTVVEETYQIAEKNDRRSLAEFLVKNGQTNLTFLFRNCILHNPNICYSL
jgi:hypothetical protein